MTHLYALNHTCDIYSVTKNFRGDRTKSLILSGVKCDFFESSGKIRVSEGTYIDYDVYLHMGVDTTVQKGQVIVINGKDYLVEYAGHTPDYNGTVHMQFIALKEGYAV